MHNSMLYRDFLNTPRPCPFCAPVQKVFAEKESVYLTYALAPYHPHHLLVVPRRHSLHFLDLSAEEQIEIDMLIRKAFEALERLGYQNITVLVREGEGSGKSIEHVHYHIIPNIRIGDIDHNGNERAVLSPEEISSTCADLEKVLNITKEEPL